MNHTIDGFFACGDSNVLLNIPLFLQCGYRLPEDLALMGFYDTSWCTFLNIQLSSVNVHPEQVIQSVWDMYIGRKAKSQEKIQPQLVQRDSTLKFVPRSEK
jgi:DNA-binding LacI/PurR family transcriptional regulator